MFGRRFGARFLKTKPRHARISTRNYRIMARFSSWQYPEVPWRRVSEEDIEKAKKLVLLQRQSDELTKAVQTAVRAHLQAEFPKAFSLTSSRNIWKNFRAKDLNEKAHTLLQLNGFQSVPLPKPMDMLMLAEGVVAFPNFYGRIARTNEFILFAQPIVKKSSRDTENDKLYPAIIQEDIQIYRILENQAEGIINAMYNVAQAFVNNVIHRPFELIIKRIQVITKIVRKKLKSSNDPVISAAASHPNIRLPSMVDQPSTEPTENLLVIGEARDELTLFAHMSPTVRLVALPHILGHKSASTLVSVSLVFFGALPLAYRSLNYASLYPGLSEALAISVIGTITYGIWSQRYNARISQSRAVANALLHRVQARNDAVVLVLQEGAVRQVSQAVLSEYFDRLVNTTKIRGEDKELLMQLTTPDISVASTDLVNPLELAVKLNLLELVGGTDAKPTTNPENRSKFKAVPLEDGTVGVKKANMVMQT
jgi:hypothetical protein